MLKKKERVHASGASNIDFRSIRDNESIQFFQPWKNPKHNGTMGQSYLEKPYDDMKNLVKIAKNVLTTKELNFQTISPKLYSSVKFYSLNQIPIKKRSYINSDKVAELDEFSIGKQRYVGDSNINSKDIKITNLKKNFSASSKACLDNPNIDRLDRHNNSDLETQLVTIKASHTDKNKIDLRKIRDVILALRRRYQNRTNIPKIFKEWDISNNGVISINDAHRMINNLGIPINIKETNALISTSSYENKENLDLESFIEMIFSENKVKHLNKIGSKLDVMLNEDASLNVNKILERKNSENRQPISKELSKKDEVQYLKEFLKSRFPILVKHFSRLEKLESRLCDLSTFSDVIKSFKISSRYTNPEVILELFNEFKTDNNLIDYRKFVDNISLTKEKNYFFSFNENYANLLENKANKIKKELANYRDDNIKLIKAEEELNRCKMEVLEEQRFNKANQLKLHSYDDRYIRNSQPNKEFFLKLWSNREEYDNKRKEIVNLYQPSNLLKDIYRGNGRFSSNKSFLKDTSKIICTTEGSGHYVSEKEKFDRSVLNENIALKGKNIKQESTVSRLDKLQKQNEFFKERNEIQNFLQNEKKMCSLIEKTKKLRIYEMVNENLNLEK